MFEGPQGQHMVEDLNLDCFGAIIEQGSGRQERCRKRKSQSVI